MVKSPGKSPERKKVKIDVYPMIVKDPQAREINESHLLNYTTALSGFETPTEEQLLVVEGDNFRHHPNEDVEQYFVASAQWGVPAIAWNIVRPAFLWKLEFCITEFMNVEKKKKEAAAANPNSDAEKPVEAPPREKLTICGLSDKVLIKTTPVVFNTEESMEFVLDKAKTFDGFPFTWQRLCELLTEPMKHYSTVDKFLRAVDKVINVVTTINEHGGKSFGDWDVPHSQNHHMENLFFGAVDEVEMMDLEKHKNEYQSSSEEPLDMSTKSMPAPRVSASSPNPHSFAPPTSRSPKHNSPSSPKGTSPSSSPKAISPVSSPKSAAAQNQSPKKEESREEPKEESKNESRETAQEEPKNESYEEKEEVKETINEKEGEETKAQSDAYEEEMPEETKEPEVEDEEIKNDEEMDCGLEVE